MLEKHLEKLESFRTAAQGKSLLKASEVLGISQPAITKNIRFLENLLGTTLFLRHRRGVDLTKAGIQLYEYSENIFLKTRDIQKRIRSSQELSGIIRVGTYETLGELFWPKAIKAIAKKYPDLTLELTTQSPESIWSKLESGSIDLIVDAEPKTADHLFSKILYSDQFGVFCKKGSRFLNQAKDIPIAFVQKATDRNKNTIEQHLKRMGLSYLFLYDVESFTFVRSLLLEDACIGVLPLQMAQKYMDQGTLLPFANGERKIFGEHRICATYLDANKKEKKIQALVEILKSLHWF